MCRISPRRTLSVVCLVVLSLSEHLLLAQVSQPTQREEPKLVVNVEDFCSPTKLRTSNARIRWSMPSDVLAAAQVSSLSSARQSLEATVFHRGFEKGLFVSIPMTQATPDSPIAARAPGKTSKLRAFQFFLIQVEQPKAAAQNSTEMAAVVEGLEPGVDYTWRIAIETDSGRLVSVPATSEAVVCPADMVPTPPVNRRKR
jgi:hypothetical protein